MPWWPELEPFPASICRDAHLSDSPRGSGRAIRRTRAPRRLFFQQFNNWSGNGWRWFLKYGIVEAWSATSWLPGGANEDAELRQLQEARDVGAFKERCISLANQLDSPSDLKGKSQKSTIPQVGDMFCKMKRGDLVVMNSGGDEGQDKGEWFLTLFGPSASARPKRTGPHMRTPSPRFPAISARSNSTPA